MFLNRSFALILAFATVAAGCGDSGLDGPDGGAAGPDGGGGDAGMIDDPSDALFRPDHILEINITLAAGDWALLREEPDQIGMPSVTCGNQPTEDRYNYYPGEITIDGTTVGNVGVRKKGGFGSLSSLRPGLKIKANEYVMGQRISGLKRLTLNNNHQDDTLISQCLGYGLFRAAGLPASRCSFAHVTVNGEDLGIYSNVESIEKDFLARHFSDDTGRLYESGGDFYPGQTNGYQPKVDKTAPDCSDLDGVVAALQQPDATFESALGAVVDLDEFMTFWAMEVLTDHWDGYANNRNNHFFYHDPASDKFHFIPWGTDALFSGRERTTRPYSVFACGSLPWRLYDLPATRARYLNTLRDLLATVWDEDAIIAEINRMQALIEPVADPTNDGKLAANIQTVRDFVRTRRAVLEAELNAGEPVWPYASGGASCLISVGTLAATFNTTWNTLDNFSAGTSTMSGTIANVLIDSNAGVSNAGLSAEGQAIVQLFAPLPDGRLSVILVIVQDPVNFVPGTRAIDLANVAGIMTFFDPMTEKTSGGGLLLNGSLTLSSASTTSAAPVIGSLTADVIEF